MVHFRKPIIEEHGGKRYLKPYAQSGLGAVLHTSKASAVQQADEEAEKYREIRSVIAYADGFVCVNLSGYLVLFASVPGDDEVYRAQPG